MRPEGSPPIPASYLKQIEKARPRFAQMAKEQHGLIIDSGPFGIKSRKALIGEKYAEAMGHERAYHDGVIEAYWRNAEDISDLEILRKIAESSGMNGDDFMNALDDPQYDNLVTKDVMIAMQYGLNGVPALIFNNKYLVSGAQPYESLAELVEKIADEMDEE